ncbi:MAG: hypothetical protein E6K92_07190 [Thaumarchaeota archaeon]|nr:MAG: hypothetical protein E6K92_07190 [Nitrososphaerota archaeon]
MRFIIRAQLPTEVGNRMMENADSLKELEGYIKNINAENAYFFEANGDRTMVFIANMERADQMAMIAEPLFTMGAKVEFHPVMVLEDLKKINESRLVTKSIS